MQIAAPTIILKPGQRGTYGGFDVTVVRHYDGNMYEIRFPGGLSCVDATHFVPATSLYEVVTLVDGVKIALNVRAQDAEGAQEAAISKWERDGVVHGEIVTIRLWS